MSLNVSKGGAREEVLPAALRARAQRTSYVIADADQSSLLSMPADLSADLLAACAADMSETARQRDSLT